LIRTGQVNLTLNYHVKAMKEDKWISVDKRSNKLVVRFRLKNFDKQFYIASGLEDTKRNREIVRLKCEALQTDIALDRFDSTLASYQFKGRKTKIETKLPLTISEYNILQLWDKFTDFQESQLEQTTILNRYARIKSFSKRLPIVSLKEAPKIREWLLNNTTKSMAWMLINAYSQCCDWAITSELIIDNPFIKLKFKEPKRNENDYKAFTLQQRDLIIEAFQNSKHFHYTSLIQFLFWTGCRPGEAFALTWNDISEDYRQISINKSCNLCGITKTTKTGKKRVFPISSDSKLQGLLKSLRHQTNGHQLIFSTVEGKPVTSTAVNKIWKGQVSQGYRYLGVVQEMADQGKLPYYLNAYATRHTFATWAITSGVSPDKVAKWIGDKVETVLKYYCHPSVVEADCPDF
jgi:integrase